MMNWADSFAALLLATTVAVSLAAVVTALLLWGLRCRAPLVHRVAWCLVLVQGWIFLQVPVPLPGWLVAPVPERSEEAPTMLARAEPPRIGELSERYGVGPRAEELAAEMPSSIKWPAPTEDEEAYGPWYGEGELAEVPVAGRIWPVAVVIVWLGGMVVAAAVGLWRYVRFVRGLPEPGPVEPAWAAEWRQVAVPRGAAERVTLLPVAAAVGPLLCRLPGGYALILPAPVWGALTPAGRRAVLRHELAHWERSDLVKSLLVRLLALPQWFNPLAWLALRRYDEAAEWSCDALAAAESPATEYAGALVSIVERTAPSACGAAAQGSELAQRVRRLILEREEDSIMKRVLVLSLAATLVAFAAVRFERAEGLAAHAVESASVGQSELDQPSPGDEAETAAERNDAAEEATVEAMRRAWAERRAKIDSLYCEIALEEYVVTDPPGARQKPAGPFAPPEPPSPEAKPTLTLEGKVRFWIAGEKMALRLDPLVHNPVAWDEIPLTRRELTFDGNVAQYLHCLDGKAKMGGIAREPWLSHDFSAREWLRDSMQNIGVWLSIDPTVGIEAAGMGLKAADIDSGQLTVKRNWTGAAGNRLLEIELPSIVPDMQNLLYVDVSRGYLPVRVERRRRGQTMRLVTLTYVEDPDIDWRIVAWTDSLMYPPSTTMYRTIERFEVNQAIADEVFELVLPEGARMLEIRGEEERGFYVARTGGVLEEVSEEEYYAPWK